MPDKASIEENLDARPTRRTFTDAELVLDTSELPIDQAVHQVLDRLGADGWIDSRRPT